MLEALQNLDGSILLAVQGARVTVLDPVISLYTKLGDVGLVWILLSLAMVCWKPTRRTGTAALTALFLGMLCTNVILKHIFLRPRPWLNFPIVPLVTELDPNSFPSGHTCAAFAAGLVWARGLPWRWARRLAPVLAVCMGLSRLYVGVHYPSDVLVGTVVGTACAWAAWRLILWHEARGNMKRN